VRRPADPADLSDLDFWLKGAHVVEVEFENKLAIFVAALAAGGYHGTHNPAIFFARVQNLSEPLFKVRHAAAPAGCWRSCRLPKVPKSP
jgi:hypothetical protein